MCLSYCVGVMFISWFAIDSAGAWGTRDRDPHSIRASIEQTIEITFDILFVDKYYIVRVNYYYFNFYHHEMMNP